MAQELKTAFALQSYEKMQMIRKIREKSFRSSQFDLSRNFSNRSSRPSSAARKEQKEEVVPKRKNSKLLTSPYMQTCIPDKNPSFRLKQISNPNKVPKSRSFAVLDV